MTVKKAADLSRALEDYPKYTIGAFDSNDMRNIESVQIGRWKLVSRSATYRFVTDSEKEETKGKEVNAYALEDDNFEWKLEKAPKVILFLGEKQ